MRKRSYSLLLPTYYYLSAGNQRFVLKYVDQEAFRELQTLNNRLRGNSKHIRLIQDIVPNESMFVFQYFTGHLLRLVQKDLPLPVIKRILKDSLRGIAELHDQDIVHTGDLRRITSHGAAIG